MSSARTAPVFAAAILLSGGVLVSAGCGSTTEAERAEASVAATQSRGELYGLPEMQEARYHRAFGADALQRAYAASRPVDRVSNFDVARRAFERSADAYHEALVRAPAAYHGVIDGEIEAVGEYLRQIQRDRPGPRAIARASGRRSR